MNTWRSNIMQFGTPIVLLVCLIVAMHQRDRTFTAAVEAQNLAIQFKRISMEATLQTSQAIEAMRVCQSNFTSLLGKQQPHWELIPSSVTTSNALDSWRLQDRSTWQLSVDFDNDGSEALFVYGELVGHIVNCKFIPFQKP